MRIFAHRQTHERINEVLALHIKRERIVHKNTFTLKQNSLVQDVALPVRSAQLAQRWISFPPLVLVERRDFDC